MLVPRPFISRSHALAASAFAASLLLAACAPQPSTSAAPTSAPARGSASGEAKTQTVDRAAELASGSSQAAVPGAKPAAKPAARAPEAQPAPAIGAPAPAPGAQIRPPQPPIPGPAPTPVPNDAHTELPIIQNLGRMIIYNTDLILLVTDLPGFPNRVGTIAVARGGYVAGIETKDEGGIPATTVRVKVPPQQYEATMQELRGLAVEVRNENATTQDVTEEHSDVQTQIASLEATHAQLLEILRRATTVEEVLRIQQQASQVKLQIDRLKGRAIALERLSDMATISIKGLAAHVALQHDYVAVRTQLRRAEATKAQLEAQLKRARTPEEESSLRDRLGEVALQISRLGERIADIEHKARLAGVELPQTDASGGTTTRADDTLPREYLDVRVRLRRAEWQQADLTARINRGNADEAARGQLAAVIVEVSQLRVQLKNIQDRAAQAGVQLPTLTPEEEAALAGVGPGSATGPWEIPASIRAAWNASLQFLLGVGSVLIFVWWLIPVGLVAGLLYRRQNARRAAAKVSA